MPVETAEDLATFFNEDEFAEAALYTSPAPGALPGLCTVIPDRGQGREVFAGGDSRAVTAERHVWVSAVELASVERNGIFEMLDASALPDQVVTERLRVTGLPKLDHIGHLWSVQLVMVAD